MEYFINLLGIFAFVISFVNSIINFYDKKYYDMAEWIIVSIFIFYILMTSLLY